MVLVAIAVVEVVVSLVAAVVAAVLAIVVLVAPVVGSLLVVACALMLEGELGKTLDDLELAGEFQLRKGLAREGRVGRWAKGFVVN